MPLDDVAAGKAIDDAYSRGATAAPARIDPSVAAGQAIDDAYTTSSATTPPGASAPEMPSVDEYGRPMTSITAEGLSKGLPSKQDIVNWLQPDPNMIYGSPPREGAGFWSSGGQGGAVVGGMLSPFARDPKTGLTYPTLPPALRSMLLGFVEGPENALTFNPDTGTYNLTPEAAAAASMGANPLRFGGRLPTSAVPMTPLERRVAEVTTERPPSPPDPPGPIPTEAAANFLDPDAAARIAAQPTGGPVSETGVRPRPLEAQPAPPVPPEPQPGPQPGMGPQPAGAQVTTGPIPEPTPAQKATALQKMVGQSAEDRLTPQGRDDNVYFPGVERPEAMRDFTHAPEGAMSSALQHKSLYNTDSHYHDRFDAQVKANNDVMTDGKTLPDGTRVEGLKDMFGDANAREAAMEEARTLMPGSVGLFDGEMPTNIQPIADKLNEILASGKGKIDAVANNLRPYLKKLYDAEGKPETLPSQIKGIYDDINNKLYDKSPTKEGNEARQASDQLKAVKAVVSDVIGKGLPGTKWIDYNANLSAALGQVNKLDYMQQFLTGPKSLWGRDGMLQFGKVSKMLEDIQKHHADQTGGPRQMTMDEINKIEAVRNELAAKDHLDRRAGVRGSPTVQLASGAGILGSGPLGTGIKAVAEAGAHLALAAPTGGVGNVLMLAGKGYLANRAARKAAQEAAKLGATKGRLLDTNYITPP